MVAKLRYGANALLLRNTGIYGTPVWNTVRNVNDALNQELSWQEGDATIRQDGLPVKMTEPTGLEANLTWKMLEDLNDVEFLAFRAAFLSKAALDLQVASGPITTPGETFLRGDFKVFGFKKAEPWNGINTYDVSVKPCYTTNPFQAGLTV